MHTEQIYPFDTAKRAMMTMNSESRGKIMLSGVLSPGRTLQSRKAGTKAIRNTDKTTTVNRPNLERPGNLIRPASVRPHRSPKNIN